jgi:hypothetical protein
MNPADAGDTNHADGRDYVLSVVLTEAGDGELSYRFVFADSQATASGPPAQDNVLHAETTTRAADSLEGVIAGPSPHTPARGIQFRFERLTADVRIRVYTVSGRLAATLAEDDTGGTLEWEVTNDAGEPLSSGVYICLLTNRAGETVSLRFAVAR